MIQGILRKKPKTEGFLLGMPISFLYKEYFRKYIFRAE